MSRNRTHPLCLMLAAALLVSLAPAAPAAEFGITLNSVSLNLDPSSVRMNAAATCTASCEYTTDLPAGEQEQLEAGGEGTVYVAEAYTWTWGPEAAPTAIEDDHTYSVSYTSTGDQEIEVSCTVELRRIGTEEVLATAGPTTQAATLTVWEVDAIAVTVAPDMVSIDYGAITITATATYQGSPVEGATLNFTSDGLNLGVASADTDSQGQTVISAAAGSTPSPAQDGSSVTASANVGSGDPVTGQDTLTIVQVGDPTPASPAIMVGHYTSDSLYSVVLTYTVTPSVSGVPVTFEFDGNNAGGHLHPAALEEADSSTDANGQCSVRVRSSDVREGLKVWCKYAQTSGSTTVSFYGIDSLSGHTAE